MTSSIDLTSSNLTKNTRTFMRLLTTQSSRLGLNKRYNLKMAMIPIPRRADRRCLEKPAFNLCSDLSLLLKRLRCIKNKSKEKNSEPPRQSASELQMKMGTSRKRSTILWLPNSGAKIS
jgi:hypothetical protein